MASTLQARIAESTRAAMRSRDRKLLAALRLINAELKQEEIDQSDPLEDTDVNKVLARMIKQRRSSAQQYADADRQDLADQEGYEIDVIESFTPQQLTDEEILSAVESACVETGANSLKQMGQVMKVLSVEMSNRADMSKVSAIVRARLAQQQG